MRRFRRIAVVVALSASPLLSAPCLAQPVIDDPEVLFPGHPNAPGGSGGAPGSPPTIHNPAPVPPAPSPCCVFDPLPPQPPPAGPGPIEPAVSGE